MKTIYKSLFATLSLAAAMSSCVDEVKFGDSFIEKAPGGTVTIDSIFASPEYTEQFLTSLYAYQYYGLPYNNNNKFPNHASPYTGKFDALTDCYQLHWGATAVYTKYYNNSLTASDTPLMSFTKDKVWESVRQAWILIENIDRVPEMSDAKKANFVAQAKTMIACRYFDLFPHYGGLPLIDHSFTGNEGSYHMERASVENTVKFMVKLLDEAIPNLPWAFDGNTSDTNSSQLGHWTKAGAMALKAKILTFAASPIFNADAPYLHMDNQEMDTVIWYGNYDAARWQTALKACKDFFDANAGGQYHLIVPTAKKPTPDDYRFAYRNGYILDASPEILHYTRVAESYGSQGTYSWWSWAWQGNGINRNNYSPTQEYMEMFPWSDGTPFNWEADFAKKIDGEKGQLFFSYEALRGGTVKKTASRDPRLYENAIVNGQLLTLDNATGKSTGNPYELWVGGYNAQFSVVNSAGEIAETSTTIAPTGYGVIKYVLGEELHRNYNMHWNVLTYPEMLLMYAECLAQTGDHDGAITQIDEVRARVGLKGLASCHPLKKEIRNPKNKDVLIDEILRERACELGMTNNRYFDMVRYKRTDWMTKKLHGLAIYRMQRNSKGQWVRNNAPWLGADKDAKVAEPSRFEYEIFELINGKRAMWDLDPNSDQVKKWLLSPLPQTEINKNYGLVQNPGW